jgi:hypothetical protein
LIGIEEHLAAPPLAHHGCNPAVQLGKASSRNIKSRDALLLNGRLLQAVEIARQIGPFNEAALLKELGR